MVIARASGQDAGHSQACPLFDMCSLPAFLPPIDITCTDFHRLVSLSGAIAGREPHLATFLSGEIARATIRDEWDKSGYVSMESLVRFRDNVTREQHSARLVYPRQALSEGDSLLSVLSWTGAALLGLSEGHSIAWQAGNGLMRSLTVLRVD